MEPVPPDVATLRNALAAALALAQAAEARASAQEARATAAEAEVANLSAKASDDQALIAHMKLAIEKLRHDLYGQKSERKVRLLGQMEFQLEELETTATEDELAAERAAAKTSTVEPFKRRKSSRNPLPDHLPRERVVVPAPVACACCGSHRLRKLGEDVTETLEVIPRRWKVVQTVREKFSCRDCDGISQAPAPFHAIPRALAGPGLLAMMLFAKFGEHQPLNRQRDRYALEGIDLSLSTMADHVGACTFALRPLFELLRAHVLAAERLHGDDTTVPVLAKGKTDIARAWVYVRDDRPFGGPAPPAAVFYYSRDRKGEHPKEHLAGFNGILQADAFDGYNHLYQPERRPGPITEAACWAHGRRKFFKLADIASNAKRSEKATPISPLALAAVVRIDAIFEIEREINGANIEQRLSVRQQRIAPLVAELETWMRAERAKLSRHDSTAKAFNYMLNRWPSFTRFLDDGRICLTNNAAERALRGIALGRRAWLFAGSDRGGERAALMYSLIVSAKMNDIDPQAWLADVLARIGDTPQSRLGELLPWNWTTAKLQSAA